ncbi:hypothetical protein BH09CHL1_BH09CHL1_24010 [soil metagenome]
MRSSRALVSIDLRAENQQEQIDGLKRVMMLFDEVLLSYAPEWEIKPDIASNQEFYRRTSQGHLEPVREFNPFHDAEPTFTVSHPRKSVKLVETVAALKEAGIVREVDLAGMSDLKASLQRLRILLGEHDFLDPNFQLLTGLSPRNAKFEIGRFTFEPLPGSTINGVDYYMFPLIARDSFSITESLFYAHHTHSNAVFVSRRFQSELNYRYRQFSDGMLRLIADAPEIAAALKGNAKFGEVAFNVANSVVSSPLLQDKTIEELIQLRRELDRDRQRFVSSGLTELEEMITDNPWSAVAKEEMNRYIRGKLAADILAYDDRTTEIWNSLFGRIRAKVIPLTAASVLPSLAAERAGGFLGSVAPHSSAIGILIGAAVAVGGAAKIWEDVEAALAESRAANRNAIAYVAKLARHHK